MGISFDDGPQQPTSALLSFLKENNQSATHFMIGSRIHENPDLLLETYNKNHDHIAVHTWSREFLLFFFLFINMKGLFGAFG
jgi:peptidoglycan/xylan/chitin deacetylase (PgdA/CDA1 family)